ncbi:MAG: CsbD family protein [Polyangiales bacterium]
MNRDQVQGQFTKLQGEAKRLWGQLTDDDFKQAQGSSDKLIGIIQQRFGDTKDAIRKKLNL